MSCHFISDLHLDESRPAVTRAFFHYLEQWAGNCDALYILGDFFEVWLGDDDDAPLAREVVTHLKNFSDSGSKLYFMHGNRDFLLGQQFCQQTGGALLNDPTLIDLYGTQTLLMHGDSLCTQDLEYMAFRQQARSEAWQQQLLSQPLSARRELAKQLRNQSQSMNALKAEDIMDVTHSEVERMLSEHHSYRLIHGHTHRPNRHQFMINNHQAERIVLGDWCDSAWILTVNAQGLELQQFKL